VPLINLANDGKASLSQADIDRLRSLFDTFFVEIMGVRPAGAAAGENGAASTEPFEKAIDLLLQIRAEAKARKDWATSDLIRNRMAEIGFEVKDKKDGVEWSLKK
ncbi:MAG: cysteine--tRNA ligase, partial [Paramuribaculum sp.]|nr:cysteine--tRNA ligase [Paramuribaculum sp.]